MINLQSFLEAIEFKISGGSEYLWNSFGNNVRTIESSVLNRYSASATFDTETNEVYMVEAHDEDLEISFRMINPDYINAYIDECEQRNVNFGIAYDQVRYIDLDHEEDMLEKINAIVNGEEYDTRVLLKLNLPEDIILALALQAHELDITLNDHMCNIIMEEVERLNSAHFK